MNGNAAELLSIVPVGEPVVDEVLECKNPAIGPHRFVQWAEIMSYLVIS